MFRSVISVSRSVSKSAFTQSSRFALKSASTNLFINNQNYLQNKQVRFYSHAPELTKEIISERVIELLESYSKTAEGVEITHNTSFSKDLGYDSFDIVEVVMELEYEFSILIPDKEADEIKTVGQAVDFISKQPDAC
jgi:NADH dehydrogenase (ubiquinone) 1 alpha/beta subcomplex 1